jgi:hypothetical protein
MSSEETRGSAGVVLKAMILVVFGSFFLLFGLVGGVGVLIFNPSPGTFFGVVAVIVGFAIVGLGLIAIGARMLLKNIVVVRVEQKWG